MRSASARSARDAIAVSALSLFGQQGIDATSLREVAAAAGVSPALVVHHFGGKDGLLAATDEAALKAFGSAYGSDQGPGTPAELLDRRAEQTARVMREHPDLCAYLGRALVERTPGATRLFGAMIEGGRKEIDALAERGALRADVDRLWATLQHFFLIWAPLSFMPLLDDALDGRLLDAENLDRWVSANAELLERGIYR
ncbi:MAG TPA: helix-turn-helix domain-containing protein [Solirubrobacterales bacterium]|nr:helix-turn-helix domain-containing protein [Solirubrobacterales bacterium]